MTQGLKRCPFCGSDKITVTMPDPGHDEPYHCGAIQCDECEAMIVGDPVETIAKWNAREPHLVSEKENPDRRDLAAARIREILESFGASIELELITNYPDDGYLITFTFGKEICVTDTFSL